MHAEFGFSVFFERFIPIIPNPILKAIPSLAEGRCTQRAGKMDVNHCQSTIPKAQEYQNLSYCHRHMMIM